MVDNETPKPADQCPFCGGLSLFFSEEIGMIGPEHRLMCSGCGTLGPIAKTREEAVEKWNKRDE